MSDDDDHGLDATQASDRRILRRVLFINVAQCAAGLGIGAWASSTAVMGAALDNLADACVYAMSLYAVGGAIAVKTRAARLSGWLLIGLAFLMLSEVLRRFFGGEAPLGPAMILMAAINAGLNIVCLRLLSRHKGDDINFKASSIFTSNDSLVNLAIVLSGVLVMWSGSNLPDLILGVVVSGIAFRGGREILAEARQATQENEPERKHSQG